MAGVTYEPRAQAYMFQGNQYGTLDAAQAAARNDPALSYNPVTQTFAPTPTAQFTTATLPSGQKVQGPALLKTDGVLPGGGWTPPGSAGWSDTSVDSLKLPSSSYSSMASLARAADPGSSAAADNLARTNAAADRRAQEQYDTEKAATAAQTARDAQERDQAFQTATTATAAQNARDTQARMFAMFPQLMASIMGPAAAPVSDAPVQQAQDAAFARAKDRTADLARSSLMTLRGAAAEAGRNVSGGTNPALQASEGQLMAKANQPLADLTRQQAIDTTSRAQSVADRNYAGDIALQGQKTALAPSMLSLLKVGGLY